jgi:hypothetical protein
MAGKTKSIGVVVWKPIPVKKRTSIGASVRTRPKHKNNGYKKYRGQGK